MKGGYSKTGVNNHLPAHANDTREVNLGTHTRGEESGRLIFFPVTSRWTHQEIEHYIFITQSLFTDNAPSREMAS